MAGATANPIAEYWDALAAIIADLTVTDEELEYLLAKKRQLRLEDRQLRAVHAKAFARVIGQFTEDRILDDREARLLNRVQTCLRQLGWAPGDVA
jgi:hypothetical protein